MPAKRKLTEEERKHRTRIFDFFIRLPKNKKYIKEEIKKIAQEYDVPMNRILLDAIEYYLGRRKKKTFIP